MAKKKAAKEDFKMSAVVREGLGWHAKESAREIRDYVEPKHPGIVKTTGHTVDMEAWQAAAKLIRAIGGTDAAIEAIKSVQAVEVR